jgi:hypothetical protein
MDVTSIIQYLETLKYGYSESFSLVYKVSYLDSKEVDIYKTGYKDGFTKGIDEAIKIINERMINE